MEVKYFENRHAFIKASINFIKKICASSNHPINLALSGGSTPRPVYEKLATSRLDFSNIHIYQVDERFVPANHAESNQAMITQVFSKVLKQHPAHFHYFLTNLSIEKSLQKYADEIKNVTFDLCILGMGTDGHIASLFPESAALMEKKKLTAHTLTDNFAIKNRLTMTFPAIMKSKKILLLLKGSEKKTILEELLKNEKKIAELPAKKLLEHDNLTIHYGNF